MDISISTPHVSRLDITTDLPTTWENPKKNMEHSGKITALHIP